MYSHSVSQFREICIKYNFPFPDFHIEKFINYYQLTIKWAGIEHTWINYNESLLYTIAFNELIIWLDNPINFLSTILFYTNKNRMKM